MALAAPPHPQAVFRVLKTAYRQWLAGGTAAAITITTIPNIGVATLLNIQGTVTVNPGDPMPATVSVVVKQGASTVFTPPAATVNPVTGAWAGATVPGNTLAAGSYTAVATTTNPAATTTSNAFTVT